MLRWIYIAAVLGLLVLAVFTSSCAWLADLQCSSKAADAWAQSYIVKDGQCYIGPSARLYSDPIYLYGWRPTPHDLHSYGGPHHHGQHDGY